MCRRAGSQRAQGKDKRVPGGQGVGQQSPRRSRGILQGPRGSMCRPTGPHGVGLEVPKGSRGRPAGSQGINREVFHEGGGVCVWNTSLTNRGIKALNDLNITIFAIFFSSSNFGIY